MAASNEKQEARRAEKAKRRAERRKRHEARKAAAGKRDVQLQAAFSRYRAETKRIWDDWRAA